MTMSYNEKNFMLVVWLLRQTLKFQLIIDAFELSFRQMKHRSWRDFSYTTIVIL